MPLHQWFSLLATHWNHFSLPVSEIPEILTYMVSGVPENGDFKSSQVILMHS